MQNERIGFHLRPVCSSAAGRGEPPSRLAGQRPTLRCASLRAVASTTFGAALNSNSIPEAASAKSFRQSRETTERASTVLAQHCSRSPISFSSDICLVRNCYSSTQRLRESGFFVAASSAFLLSDTSL